MVNPTAQGTSTTCVTPIECAPSTTYTWVTGNYGSCSVSTCGGGTQTRNIVCQDNNGSTVADSYCTDPKPAETQSCNTQACACPVL